MALFQRRGEGWGTFLIASREGQRGPSSPPPFSQGRGAWPSPSLSEKESWPNCSRGEGVGRLPPLFLRRDDSSSSSSLIEVRGPLFSISSLGEKVWLAFPLSFGEGVMALFLREGDWHSPLSFREGETALFQRRAEGCGHLPPRF